MSEDKEKALRDIADYVVDYPRFEESANEVAELIYNVLEQHFINKHVDAVKWANIPATVKMPDRPPKWVRRKSAILAIKGSDV